MKGLLLLSHGNLAEGVLDTLGYFFANEMEQVAALVLTVEDDLESFTEKLKKKIETVDRGDGTIIFTDLAAGTPTNVATALLLEGGQYKNITLVTGLNLPMVIEAMNARDSDDIDFRDIVEIGKSEIKHVNEIFENETVE